MEFKKIQLYLAAFLLLMFCTSCSSIRSSGGTEVLKKTPKRDKIIVAYVTSWTAVIPETDYITHINYAFGHVNETFDGVSIDNEERLREIVKLKEQKSDLKILLSIGGWGSGRFSEMAADDNLRESFVRECRWSISKYGLDGIDLDWEFPGSGSAGISHSKEDRDNFTKLIDELRSHLGSDKLLTLASSSRRIYYDFPKIIDKLDFVNIMTYDMGSPPFHHSALFPSAYTRFTGDNSIKMHLNAGIPKEKLVLGIPFYGRGRADSMKFLNYKDVKHLNLTEKWDTLAKVPFLVNTKNEIVFVYENPVSITYKCDYVLKEDLRGVMFWEYAGDDEHGSLRKSIWMKLKR